MHARQTAIIAYSNSLRCVCRGANLGCGSGTVRPRYTSSGATPAAGDAGRRALSRRPERRRSACALSRMSSVFTQAISAAMQTMKPRATSRIVPLLAPIHTELPVSLNVSFEAYVKNAEHFSYGATVPCAAEIPCWTQVGTLSIATRHLLHLIPLGEASPQQAVLAEPPQHEPTDDHDLKEHARDQDRHGEFLVTSSSYASSRSGAESTSSPVGRMTGSPGFSNSG